MVSCDSSSQSDRQRHLVKGGSKLSVAGREWLRSILAGAVSIDGREGLCAVEHDVKTTDDLERWYRHTVGAQKRTATAPERAAYQAKYSESEPAEASTRQEPPLGLEVAVLWAGLKPPCAQSEDAYTGQSR